MISPLDAGEKLQPLLKKILGYLCQTRDMPLRAEIDSVGIVNASLKQFPTWQNEQSLDCLREGQTVKAIFDVLVERALQDEPEPRETGPRLQIAEQRLPAVNGGNDASGRVAAQVTEDNASHPLVFWLQQFYVTLRDVHPMAIEIVKLRVDGYTNREIAERLGWGLRLVNRIQGEVRVALAMGEN